MISSRSGRIAQAISGHSIPLPSFAIAKTNDGYAFVVIYLVTYTVFAFAWVPMLRRG